MDNVLVHVVTITKQIASQGYCTVPEDGRFDEALTRLRQLGLVEVSFDGCSTIAHFPVTPG